MESRTCQVDSRDGFSGEVAFKVSLKSERDSGFQDTGSSWEFKILQVEDRDKHWGWGGEFGWWEGEEGERVQESM